MIIELPKITYVSCLQGHRLNKPRLSKKAKKISGLKNAIKAILPNLLKLLIWTLMKRQQHILKTLGGQILVLSVYRYETGILREAGTTPTGSLYNFSRCKPKLQATDKPGQSHSIE